MAATGLLLGSESRPGVGSVMMRVMVVCALACAGCSGDAAAPPNVRPGEAAVLTEGPATLTLPAGEHRVAEGRGAIGVRVEIEVGRDDAAVHVEPGETLASAIVTVRHDQEGALVIRSLDDADQLARLRLEIDPARLPAGDAPSASRLVVVARYPAEREGEEGPEATEMETARALGEVDAEGGAIEVDIVLLPPRMDVAVVYSPLLAEVAMETPAPEPTWRTMTPPWPCCAVYMIYPTAPTDRDCSLPEFDNNSACRLRKLAERLHGAGDAATIGRVMRERFMTPALAALRKMANLGVRRPKLEWRELPPSGRPHAVLHAGWGASRYILGGPFGEVNIGMRVIESLADDGASGTVMGHLVHELTHAAVEGYDIRTVQVGNRRALRGFNEGLAMVLENTLATDSTTAQVRSGAEYAIYRLGMPLGDYRLAYANDDFFAYAWRRFLDNDLTFIAGDEGLLEMLALYSGAAGLTTGEDFRVAYLRGLDDALRSRPAAVGLGDVFEAFVRNRFYEHDEASRLRAGDMLVAHQAALDLFTDVSQRVVVPVSDGLKIVIPSPAAPLWVLEDKLTPMSSALVVFEAAGGAAGGSFEGKLELDFEVDGGRLGDDGLRVTMYREGFAGERVEGAVFVAGDFGVSHERLYALIVNASLDGPIGLSIAARTEEGEEPTPVLPDVKCPESFFVRECEDRRCPVFGGAACETHTGAVAWSLEPHDALYRVGEVIDAEGHYRLRCRYGMPGQTCGAGFMAYWTTPDDVGGPPSYPQYACGEPGQLVTGSVTRVNSATHQAAVGVPAGGVTGADAVFKADVMVLAEEILARVEPWAALCE